MHWLWLMIRSSACAVVQLLLFKGFKLSKGWNWPWDTFPYSLLFKYIQLLWILIYFRSILFCNNNQCCFKRIFLSVHSSVVMLALMEMGEIRELLFDRTHWTSLERKRLIKIGLDLLESLSYLPSLNVSFIQLEFIESSKFESSFKHFVDLTEGAQTFMCLMNTPEFHISLNVTRHEKIGLMCTKYTLSHYSTYLTFRVSYASSVNCIQQLIACCTSTKCFISKQSLITKIC